jgi:cysteinyl-tRNA synthetase
LKFPHHENEIAQCGGSQANFFIHNEFLNIDNQKMSKSLGNITKLNDIKNPLAFRLLVLQAHYRSHMDFTQESLQASTERLHNLQSYADQMLLAWPDQLPTTDESGATAQAWHQFSDALEDDLNTPAALAALNIIEGKAYSQETLEVLKKIEAILGIGLIDETPLSSEAKALITDYDKARSAKEYVVSDKLREKLKTDFDLELSDTQYGPLVNRSRS